MDKYKKMYLESIQRLVQTDVLLLSKIIFCMDCPQADIWRNAITDSYKGNRIDLSQKNNFRPVFKYTYDILIPDLIKIMIIYFQ